MSMHITIFNYNVEVHCRHPIITDDIARLVIKRYTDCLTNRYYEPGAGDIVVHGENTYSIDEFCKLYPAARESYNMFLKIQRQHSY